MISKRQFGSDLDGQISALFNGDEQAQHAEVHRYEHEPVAASLLGEFGDLRAVPALIEALPHNYSQYDLISVVGPTAAEALTRMTGMDFGTNQRAWQEWWSETSDTI